MELRKKSASWLMRALGFLLTPVSPKFMTGFWTTIGSTVYAPTIFDADEDWGSPSWRERHHRSLHHETIHTAQFERWGLLLMGLAYLGPSPFLLPLAVATSFFSLPAAWGVFGATLLALPLTVGLAYGRWRIERDAYLPSVRAAYEISAADGAARLEHVVKGLWGNYGAPWPKSWMTTWFYAQIFPPKK